MRRIGASATATLAAAVLPILREDIAKRDQVPVLVGPVLELVHHPSPGPDHVQPRPITSTETSLLPPQIDQGGLGEFEAALVDEAAGITDADQAALQRRPIGPYVQDLEGKERINVLSRELWEAAFTRLDLSDQEILQRHMKTISPAVVTIDSIVQSVLDRRLEVERRLGGMLTIPWRGKKLDLAGIMDNIIRWADRFKAIGDTIVQYDPGHMALPWAVARFLIQVWKQPPGLSLY